jgi:hypothetical protein
MKTNVNGNDPIHPIEVGFEDGEVQQFRQISNHTAQANGLTKREYFAAMAMQGLLAGHYEYFTGNSDVSVPEEIAKYAVLNADFLITELNK